MEGKLASIDACHPKVEAPRGSSLTCLSVGWFDYTPPHGSGERGECRRPAGGVSRVRRRAGSGVHSRAERAAHKTAHALNVGERSVCVPAPLRTAT